jgi:hypothetical protein
VASAKSTSGSSGAGGGEAALASALQQGILAAGGLQALLKVCKLEPPAYEMAMLSRQLWGSIPLPSESIVCKQYARGVDRI